MLAPLPSHASSPRQQQQDDSPATPTKPHPMRDENLNAPPASEELLQPDDRSSTTDAPPFWSRHDRTVSTVSYHSMTDTRNPILLEDRSQESHEATQFCWAKSVTIDDYTILTGPTGIGAYVVWHCTVGTLKGGDLELRKRYSEFDQLRADIVRSFPHAEAMIPELPRKSVVSRFRPRFLESRKQGLSHFLNCILLNPEFAASPVLKDFIFS